MDNRAFFIKFNNYRSYAFPIFEMYSFQKKSYLLQDQPVLSAV